jgi:outer membrane protein OmpA-like peptidoglycan-associated protein
MMTSLIRYSFAAAFALLGLVWPDLRQGPALAAGVSSEFQVAQVGAPPPAAKKKGKGQAKNKANRKGKAQKARRGQGGANKPRRAGARRNASPKRKVNPRKPGARRAGPTGVRRDTNGVVRRPGQGPDYLPDTYRIPKAAKQRRRNLNDVRRARKRHRENGGRRNVIIETGDRRIVREGRRKFIRNRDNNRLSRRARQVRQIRRNGRDITRVTRRNGVQIVTVRDRRGRVVRRVRIGRNGRRTVLFTNNYRGRRRDRGGLSAFWLGLALPLIAIPTYRYIVDSRRASYGDMYDALSAPPVQALDDRYTLDEVRYNYPLRARMRSVDVNTIEFASGSWLVDQSEYGRLKNLANAMRRVIRRNGDEMFLIEGHTDAVGDDDDNLSLSDRRAESVAVILSEEFGVPPENMVTQGYGEQFLREKTSYASQINRRVTVRRITPLLARSEETGDERYFDDDDVYSDRDNDRDWQR